jgi:epoxide hydrolase-like predicted phosphatase
MIKTLIFDNNGVITTDNEEQDLADLFSIDLEDFTGPHNLIYPDYALGKITVDEYCHRHRKAFCTKHDIEEIKKVHLNSYLLIPEMRELLISLKGKFELAMLTNFGDAFDEVNETWSPEEIFEKEKIFISSDVGLLKPDPEFYIHALDRLSRKPAEVVFIDDRRENVEAAKKMGINGILFKNREQLEKDLEKYV